MNINNSVFGAKADVYLKFDRDIYALAANLSEHLIHVPFDVAPREEAPHDTIGSCEALGCEIWLEEVSSGEYHLRFETEHCLKESFNDQMHDLSLWLARYIAAICDVDAIVRSPDGQERLFAS